MMPRGSTLLLPVNPVFIWLSLLAALLINLLPWGRWVGMPDLLAVVLVFWNVHQPRRVGVGAAFVFGLFMDVHQGAAGPACAGLHPAELFGHHRAPPPAVVQVPANRRCRSCPCLRPRMRSRCWCGMAAGGISRLDAAAGAGARVGLVAAGGLLLLAPQRRAPDP
jgi:hypothetical protein